MDMKGGGAERQSLPRRHATQQGAGVALFPGARAVRGLPPLNRLSQG